MEVQGGAVQIRLLGPLEIEDGGSFVAVGGPRLRRLLIALALCDGSSRTVDALIDIVWANGTPPPEARRTLMSYISRVRRAMPPGAVEWADSGYRLRSEFLTIDTDIFARLVASGRQSLRDGLPAEAQATLNAALALWRGEPIAEFDGEHWVESERARLGGLRLIAVVARFEAMLSLELAAEVVVEIATESDRYPFHTGLQYLRLVALCRCGRQVEALRLSHDIRKGLAQVGLELPKELCDLEQRILEDDPTLTRTRFVQPAQHTGRSAGDRHSNGAGRLSISPRLIGRGTETRQLEAALDSHRLVTVVGIGGIGKTSLLRAATDRRSASGTDVHTIHLAALQSGREVLAAIASSYGMVRLPATSGELAAALEHHDDTLLVLDNCEHVVETAADIAAAFGGCRRVRLAATSRIALGVADEQLVRLGPLPSATDAAQLFIREARKQNPEFAPDAAQRREIEAIADRCDRIPLAIELAAAHASVFDTTTILDRLDRVLVSRNRRPAEARHRTMDAAIDWSIDLLEGELARALGALTVFAGSFDTPAAEAVVALVTDMPVEQILAGLAAQSLLECREGPHQHRMRLLEPVRQRADARLVTDRAGLRDRHLDYFLERLESAYRALGTTSSQPMLDLIEEDLDNLAAVHTWALESGRLDDDMRLYRPLTPFVLWHELLPPRRWALETMRMPGAKRFERYADVVMAAAIGHFDGPENVDSQEQIRRLYDVAESRVRANRSRDPAFLGAVWLDSLAGDRRRAARNWELIELDDPHVHFLYYFIGCFARALPTDDVAGVARTSLGEGIRWARSIGAANFAAALLTTMSEFEVVFGDPQLGCDIAMDAEVRARSLGMKFAEAEAVRCQALAALHGVSTERPAASRFREILTSALRHRSGARAVFALNGVSYLFARLGYDDAAALAGHIIDETYDLRLNDRDRLSDETWKKAARRVEAGMDVFDIVRESIRTLDEIGA